MAAARLIIKKRMQFIQGKVRPCCHVQAVVEQDVQAVLEEHFVTDVLFKRAAYAQAWPQGALAIPPAIAPAMSNFLKNDACPEITVKTFLAGQLHQGANVWEMMAFEFVAKLAFENFLALCETVGELNRAIAYEGIAAGMPVTLTTDDAVQKLERMAADMAA